MRSRLDFFSRNRVNPDSSYDGVKHLLTFAELRRSLRRSVFNTEIIDSAVADVAIADRPVTPKTLVNL